MLIILPRHTIHISAITMHALLIKPMISWYELPVLETHYTKKRRCHFFFFHFLSLFPSFFEGGIWLQNLKLIFLIHFRNISLGCLYYGSILNLEKIAIYTYSKNQNMAGAIDNEITLKLRILTRNKYSHLMAWKAGFHFNETVKITVINLMNPIKRVGHT